MGGTQGWRVVSNTTKMLWLSVWMHRELDRTLPSKIDLATHWPAQKGSPITLQRCQDVASYGLPHIHAKRAIACRLCWAVLTSVSAAGLFALSLPHGQGLHSYSPNLQQQPVPTGRHVSARGLHLCRRVALSCWYLQ